MITQYSIFNIQHSPKKGAALLMAVLMTSMILSVGIGIYQRTYKELYFASFWKQTQIAFAAADAGLECVLYWDLHQVGATSANCFGATVETTLGASWDPSADATVDLSVNDPCVIVSITKPSTVVNPYALPVGTFYSTHIDARGYNTCDTSNPRRVERALSIDY